MSQAISNAKIADNFDCDHGNSDVGCNVTTGNFYSMSWSLVTLRPGSAQVSGSLASARLVGGGMFNTRIVAKRIFLGRNYNIEIAESVVAFKDC